MTKIATVALTILFLLTHPLPAAEPSESPETQKGASSFMKTHITAKPAIPDIPGITTTRTQTGITLVHQEIRKNPIVSIFIFNQKAGLLYENESKNKRGITALMQTLLTKGTATRSAKQISDDAERLGGAISASTDKDYASVEMTVASENAPKAMELIYDVIKNPTFPEDEFVKEKEAAAAGIRARKDRIFTIADDLSNLNFYGDEHPYSLPETGNLKTLEAIKRKDIITWHKKTYLNPLNLVVSIAGDIDLKTAIELVDKNFNNLASDDRLAPPEPYKGKPNPKKKEVIEKHDFKQAYLMITWPAPPAEGDEEGYAGLKFLAGALGSRMSGRLFRILREKHSLAYEVNAYYPTRKSDGRFTIYIGLDRANLETARREISAIINDIKTSGLSDTEMEETRRFLKGIWTLKRQTTSSKAFFNGYWTILTGDPSNDVKYINRILSSDKENVINAARKYLDDSKAVVVTIIPDKQK